MRLVFGLTVMLCALLSCDEGRVYEMNQDFDDRRWTVTERPEFEFEITDTLAAYNLSANVRNSLDYPYANIFLTYYLRDSADVLIKKELVRQSLFNEKTGAPLGDSGLGDIYDHRIPLLRDYRFDYAGKYKVAFEQYMRTDTLSGILAVGLRVERAGAEGR